MNPISLDFPAYVIKASDLDALSYLQPDHPRPLTRQWINRGTNQVLRRSSVDMLMRTLDREEPSPSVARLFDSTGLRLFFANESDRRKFATAFAAAQTRRNLANPSLLTAIFDKRGAAELAIADLLRTGVSEASILMLGRAEEEANDSEDDGAGHSKLSVALATAGGGMAGTMLGISLLAIPSVGPVIAVGAIASKLAAFSGIFGATGGAIARMLTDLDVDSSDAIHIERQIENGKAFLSVDMRTANVSDIVARRVVLHHQGRLMNSSGPSRYVEKLSEVASKLSQLCPA